MQTLIKNGQVIDPANQIDGPFDILIDKRKISAIEPRGKIPESSTPTEGDPFFQDS